MIGKPLVRKGSLYSFATGELPLLASPALAFCTTLGVPVYFSGGSWYKISDNSLVISLLDWTPAQIATAAWYDAADAATITESGGLVTQWADKSGNSHNLIQPIGSGQPTFSVNKLVFDNSVTIRSLYTSTSTNLLASTINFFFVRKSLKTFMVTMWNDGSKYSLVYHSGSALTSLASSYGSPSYMKDGATPSITTRNDAFTVFQDGALHIEAHIGAATNSWTLNSERINVGAYPAGAGFEGDLHEIIAVSGTITTDTRQKVEGYLAWKWGLEANLPSGHPYESYAP